MMTFFAIIGVIVVTWLVLNITINFMVLMYASHQVNRLHTALHAGKVTEIQVRVMMNEMVNPKDLRAVKEVADWLDDQGL